ncbi:ORF399 [White spot syndrome virus]|uniref:ORF399 n=1 Tax=White spot syndrome virus TaxID=342409 RepID=A0A2D3I6M4_9VIRU|nr:ORF399 [White spot syndrome virus]
MPLLLPLLLRSTVTLFLQKLYPPFLKMENWRGQSQLRAGSITLTLLKKWLNVSNSIHLVPRPHTIQKM